MLRIPQQRPGYVLVLTLGLLALAAISLSGLARYSLSCASSAREAADELQRRWGLYGARLVLFEHAAEIMEAQVRPEQRNVPPWPKPANVSTSYQLGSQSFTVTLSDEDAKVDLNTLQVRKSDRLLPAIRRLSQSVRGGDLMIRLTPQRDTRQPFASWGQLFDLTRGTTANLGAADRLALATQTMTCWGSGRLNLRTASDAAVREIASLALPAKEVGELLSHRKNWGGESVDGLLSQLDLRRPQLLAATRLFSAESNHYAMWLQVDGGQRSWSYLYVDRRSGPVCFAW